jgi:hypothetical protein
LPGTIVQFLADAALLFRGDFENLPLQLPAERDIADDAGEQTQVIDLADDQFHRKGRAVFPQPNRFSPDADKCVPLRSANIARYSHRVHRRRGAA